MATYNHLFILASLGKGHASIALLIIGSFAIIVGILRLLGLLSIFSRRDQNPTMAGLITILVGIMIVVVGFIVK